MSRQEGRVSLSRTRLRAESAELSAAKPTSECTAPLSSTLSTPTSSSLLYPSDRTNVPLRRDSYDALTFKESKHWIDLQLWRGHRYDPVRSDLGMPASLLITRERDKCDAIQNLFL